MPKQDLHNDKSNRPAKSGGGNFTRSHPQMVINGCWQREKQFSPGMSPCLVFLLQVLLSILLHLKVYVHLCVCVCMCVCIGEWAHMPNCVCSDQRTVHKSFTLWVSGIEFRSSEFGGTDFYPLSYLTGWIIFIFNDMNTPMKYMYYQSAFNKSFNYWSS